MMDDVAVIGLGCRFPGADNADEFWRVLVNGENHIVDIPPDRWNNEKYYSDKKEEPGKHYVTKAGFISGNHGWDNKFFGVSDSEAVYVDPQQRLVLECTHMAFEDAGITRQEIKGTQTGVYIGVMNDDYKGMSSFDHEGDTNYSATGMSTTIISARVSYTYDLRGPCMVIDTACSSSMVCIHLGCQAIKLGDCDMAIAGGVSSILSPDMFITLCKAGMVSPSGQCQTFCDTADGYARGEGCGIVILKSYKKAVEDRNKIWGIIKTGTNQDGHTVQPITAPSSMQQESLLTKLYSQHKIDPRELQYIEAHGTGTSIGDPTETNALGKCIQSYITNYPEETFGANTKHENSTDFAEMCSKQMERSPIMIGSVKTNIGHLESAAGVASLIKVLLMIDNEKIVPSLHVIQDKSNVSKALNLTKYNFDIPVCVMPWKANISGNRIACVNCFGFGGSNSHAIVIQTTSDVQNAPVSRSSSMKDIPIYIICVSALTPNSLHSALENLSKELRTDKYDLNDICFTSVFHRDRFSTRTLVFGSTLSEILMNIQIKMQHVETISQNKERNVVFVFCGVGTTWKGMGQEMMKTQRVFKTAILNIDEILYPYTQWSIAEKLSSDSDYTDPLLQHIAIFCIQIALFETWKYFGVQPDVIIGQSVGEIASAYASGALSLEDAVKVIYIRSSVLSKQTGGKMMVVRNISHDVIDSLCKSVDNRVTVAVYNSNSSFTLSGDADAIDEIKEQLENKRKLEADIIITPLTVQCAYHSHHMDSCVETIKNQIGNLPERKRLITHISTVTGKLASEHDFQSGTYWADNIRKSVLFTNAVRLATKEDALNIFVEIGPKPVLRAHLKSILSRNVRNSSLMSMNLHQESSSLYSSLCTLFEYGMEINWSNIMPNEGKRVPVPRYVFDRKQQLYLPQEKKLMLFRGKFKHDNTHMYVKESVGENAHYVIQIDRETTPFVYDHFMFNSTLVPGATWVEAAFEVGQRINLLNAYEIEVSTVFVNTLLPKSEKNYLLQVKVEHLQPTGHTFQITNENKVLSHGRIIPREKLETFKIDIQRIRNRMPVHKNQQESYECLHRLNFRYENSLRIIQQSWSSQTECIVEIKLPEIVQMQRKSTNIHPAIVDAIFQTFGILSSDESFTDGPTLPYGVDSFLLNRPPQTHMFVYSHLKNTSIDGNYYNSVLLTPDGQTIAEVRNFCTKSMTSTDKNNKIFYELTWQKLSINTRMLSDFTSKVGIIGSDRFLHEYIKTCDAKVMSICLSESFVNDLRMSKLDQTNCVVFAPVYHIDELENDSRSIYLKVKQNFLQLQYLFTFLAEHGVNVPLFVVTENVVGIPSLGVSSSNVIGAELWGMVRSALHEGAHNDIRLIDMELTTENLLLLNTAIENCKDSIDECVFHCGRIYISKLVEAPDERKHKVKEVIPSVVDEVELVSTSPRGLMHPVFIQRQKNKRHHPERNIYNIKLEQICLQDKAIFPSYIDNDEDITVETEHDGFKMLCIEGRGVIIEDSHVHHLSSKEKKTSVVFCFPVQVTSQVQVPKQCVCPIKLLPYYTPGLVCVGIIMKNIYKLCKHSSHILVLAGRYLLLQEKIIRAIFSKHSGLHLTVSQKDIVTTVKKHKYEFDTVVILEYLSRDDFMTLIQAFPALARVISVSSILSKRMQLWIEHNVQTVTVNILRTSDLFASNTLVKATPKVFEILKHMETAEIKEDTEHRSLGEKGIHFLTLPYPVLNMPCNSDSVNCIPLRLSLGSAFRKQSCYIIVGGLTGLGWEILKMIVKHGAPIIATMSRRKPDKNKEEEIWQLQNEYSCKIIPLQVDISDIQQVKMAIANILSTHSCHIRGIFHGGGVTRDKLLKDMTEADLDQVLLPKIQGTWNLHKATLDIHLDFFTMHSSVVSIFGNEGQCNYAAGNAFQDAVAHYRRSIGLCGQSVNWGPLAVGMAAGNIHLEKILESKGFLFLSTDDIRLYFQHALLTPSPQLMLCKLDWKKVLRNPAMKIGQQKFAGFLKNHTTPASSSHDDAVIDFEHFEKLDADEKRRLISDIVKKKLSDNFVVDEKTLDMDTVIVQLGIESLKAMSFVNEISDLTHVKIPMTTLFSEDTTVRSLSTFILAHIQTSVTDQHGHEEVEDHVLTEYLQGSVTFMQKDLLVDFIKDPFSRNFTRQVDFEIAGITMCKNEWSTVLHHLLHINPDLRRIYPQDKDTGEFTSIVLDSNVLEFHIEETSFDSLCGDNSIDVRDKIRLDIRKEIPVRVLIAIKNDITRIRMFVHSVLGDLSGIIMLFGEFANTAKALSRKEALPTKDTNIDPASAVRSVLTQQMVVLKAFWHEQLSSNIQPFTFSDNIDEELEETFWREISLPIPKDLIDKINAMQSKDGLTMFQFIVCSYMVLLHEKTGNMFIPLVTNVDMRSHIPQLKSYITRCINAIPIVGDMQNLGQVSEYLKKGSTKLKSMTEKSAYPYELIEKEMKGQSLKKHMGRHRLVMDNITDLNKVINVESVKVTLGKVFHKRHVYETTLYIVYDSNRNSVILQFGYNERALKSTEPGLMLPRLLELMKTFTECPMENLYNLLEMSIIEEKKSATKTPYRHRTSLTPVWRPSISQSTPVLNPDTIYGNASSGNTRTKNCTLTKSQEFSIRTVMWQDKFTKQTSQGWEHDVHLQIVKETNNDKSKVIVMWGNGKRLRKIDSDAISEVSVQKLKGMVYIYTRTVEREFVFKAKSSATAIRWLQKFEEASKEALENSGSFVCHL